MFKRVLKLIFSLIFFSLILSCNKIVDTNLSPGQPAPAFKLQDLSGKIHQLSDYKGKVVVLNFWASWCGPCIQEMPALSELQKNYADKGLKVISIAVDDQKETLLDVKTKVNIDFPVLLDSKSEIKNKYKISGFPETFIINREGKLVLFNDPENGLRLKIIGPRNWRSDRIKEELENLL